MRITQYIARTRVPRWFRGYSLLIVCIALMTGCASVPDRTPLPADLYHQAEIPGIPKARYWGDEPPPWAEEWFATSREEHQANHPGIFGKEHNYLAISGGGANGAFSAGLLIGWTETGTRPEFTMVTGISTGALISPFAFLGPAYDATLKEIYTGITTKDVVTGRSMLSGMFSDALASTDPLKELLQRYLTQEVMEEIAEEFRKGRSLNIGTTNLDAERPVIWNIGRIAASGHPHALELIHDLLLASAAIPVAFPPVLVDVEVNGKTYDELHVDGGGASQVFMYPIGLDWTRVTKLLDVKGRPNVYLLRNAPLRAKYNPVEPKIGNIAGRTFDSLFRTQGFGDMYRMYLQVKRDNLQYHLAHIPEDFDEESKEPFDKEYMGKLFDLGYKLAKDGYPWLKYPPGYKVE